MTDRQVAGTGKNREACASKNRVEAKTRAKAKNACEVQTNFCQHQKSKSKDETQSIFLQSKNPRQDGRGFNLSFALGKSLGKPMPSLAQMRRVLQALLVS